MKTCCTCHRRIEEDDPEIHLDGHIFCSDHCRQQHLNKTDEELEAEEHSHRLNCIRKALPWFILGAVAFLAPFTVFICTMVNGGDIDPGFLLKTAALLLPGAGIMTYSYMMMCKPLR